MKKILIIEDDEAISDALSLALEMEGYAVQPILKAKKCMETIKKFKPDLILLDLLLSGVDGRDVIRDIKKHKSFSAIPIILTSAHPTAKKVAKEMGVQGFIAKPFNLSELYRKVAFLTSRKKVLD
ncbi:response regulator [Candidatus Parcubacteria bacterium]|nr:response regulator [Candidatus Parcubacteria bacterium]